MRELRRALVAAVGLAFSADRPRALVTFAGLPVYGLVQALQPLWLKLLVDGVTVGQRGQVVAAAGLMGGAVLLELVVVFTWFTAAMRLREDIDREVDHRLIALAAGIPGVEHYERPECLDRLELLRTGRGEMAVTIETLGRSVLLVVQLATTGALLASVDPTLLLLPAFALPSFLMAGRAERAVAAAQDETAADQRRALGLFDLATTAPPGKELRVFGLQHTVRDRHRALTRALERRLARADRTAAAQRSFGVAVFSAGYLLAVLLVARQAAAGQATAGDLVLALTAAANVRGQVGDVAGTLAGFAGCLRVLRRYLWLVDHADAARRALEPPGGQPFAATPDRLVDGIRLSGVRLCYPGAEADALAEVDLHLPAGAVVAVVGENGAGKTTLVKLLARFYEPTGGRIDIDGVPLALLDPGDWRAHLAAGFEDFVRFELSAREAVGVGDLPALGDDVAVGRALERAGAADLPGQLPDGLGTLLGAGLPGAVDLSKGQWQKLALARAMMRERPLLLLLDEPTAALDAETEHALFERYVAAARTGAGNGAITVLVSHRFSTVRMADLIVVLDGGRVTEAGTHAQLHARGGLYAELYDLQADAYG